MKVILIEGGQRYTAEYDGAITWGDACSLWLSVAQGMFPYLNTDLIGDYFHEQSFKSKNDEIEQDDENDDEWMTAEELEQEIADLQKRVNALKAKEKEGDKNEGV